MVTAPMLMKRCQWVLCWAMLSVSSSVCNAAPDEELLGKSAGYPVAPSLSQAFQERYRVGSFSAMDSLSAHCMLEPSAQPLPLPKAASEVTFQYRFDGKTLTLDDYMRRQRATAVLVLKDGEIVAERSNYERTPEQRMLSNSMAKTVVALGFGIALEEGHIRSLDDRAADYEPRLAGTLYGQTRLINLLRMASGAQFIEDYSGHDDLARFNQIARKWSSATAAQRHSGTNHHPACHARRQRIQLCQRRTQRSVARDRGTLWPLVVPQPMLARPRCWRCCAR